MASIYCSNCGKLIADKSNFCRYCGAAQHGAEASVYRAQAAPTLVHAAGALAIQKSAIEEAPKSKQSKKSKELKQNEHETNYSATIIRKRKLSPRVKWSFVISYMGTTYMILLLILIGIFFDPAIFGLVFGAYTLVLYLVASIAYNQFFYSVDEDGFQKEYGVLYKNQAAIPYNKIQNVNITRSISDRMLGLARIDIETAGGHNTAKPKSIIGGSLSQAEGHLPGLTLKRAKQVHDILLHNVAHFSSAKNDT